MGYFDEKMKKAPVAGRRREHGRGHPRQNRERRAKGEVRRANTTPNGGPHLELGRLRLKTWSKSNFSIAETAWPTYLYISLQGGLRRGGLTPALAQRMPVNTEDVV